MVKKNCKKNCEKICGASANCEELCSNGKCSESACSYSGAENEIIPSIKALLDYFGIEATQGLKIKIESDDFGYEVELTSESDLDLDTELDEGSTFSKEDVMKISNILSTNIKFHESLKAEASVSDFIDSLTEDEKTYIDSLINE